MPVLEEGRIEVLTFKRGLLSKVAHDLRLRLERFEVSTDGQRVIGRFWPESLVVEGAVRDGELDRAALSDGDRREIVANIRDKILHTRTHPEARFEGVLERGAYRHSVRGELEMAGKRAPLEAVLHERDGRVSGEVELVPTRWGIEPFKALMGAIKLDDRVVVRLEFRSLEGDFEAHGAHQS